MLPVPCFAFFCTTHPVEQVLLPLGSPVLAGFAFFFYLPCSFIAHTLLIVNTGTVYVPRILYSTPGSAKHSMPTFQSSVGRLVSTTLLKEMQ